MIINNLEQDLTATNAINLYRSKHGMAKMRNPYSWWKYAFVALTYYPKGATFVDVLNDLQSVGVGNIPKTYSSLMNRVARGEERNSVQRDYSLNLPGIAKTLGLSTHGTIQTHRRGQPAIVFNFRDTDLARKVLTTIFPETIPLFNLLDKKKF